MGTPMKYLPPALSDDLVRRLIVSLDLPEPATVHPFDTTAEYHSIYVLTFTEDVAPQLLPARSHEPDGSIALILRVSGRHLPRLKTLNEVAVMTWVRSNTDIPVPAIVRFDASENNVINHEFTLLEKAPGTSLDKIYDSLDTKTKHSLVMQLTDFVYQLHSHSWNHVGGLQLDANGAVLPGPVLEETFWHVPDILTYWGTGESMDTLNISGPYKGYTAYITAHLNKYIYAIQKHSSLEQFRDMIPRLKAVIVTLTQRAEELDKTKYVLAHKDLHFGNIMYDPQTRRITAILDWEFSSVVPAPLWNPVRAFLWNVQKTDAAWTERDELMDEFEKICAERKESILDQAKPTPLQDNMERIANYLRAIVEVCPRGQRQDRVGDWRSVVEATMATFET